jgi:hypothetical protein
MKNKDIAVLACIGILAAVISAVIAGAVFGGPQNHNLKAPVVEAINNTFPDVKNDSNYKAFFNDKALDPTQLIKIGVSQNQQPFSSNSQ